MIALVLHGLAVVIRLVLNMLMVVIFVSVMISWLSADPSNPYVRMVGNITEPLYRPFRRLTGRIGGPIDLAPMMVILIVIFLLEVVPRYLESLARGLP